MTPLSPLSLHDPFILGFDIYDCSWIVDFDVTKDCQNVVGTAGEVSLKLDVSLGLGYKGKTECDAACTEIKGHLGEVNISGEATVEIQAAGIFKGKYSYSIKKKLAEGFALGPYGSCN